MTRVAGLKYGKINLKELSSSRKNAAKSSILNMKKT